MHVPFRQAGSSARGTTPQSKASCRATQGPSSTIPFNFESQSNLLWLNWFIPELIIKRRQERSNGSKNEAGMTLEGPCVGRRVRRQEVPLHCRRHPPGAWRVEQRRSVARIPPGTALFTFPHSGLRMHFQVLSRYRIRRNPPMSLR